MLRSLAAIVGLSLVALILASIIESHREVLPGLFAKVSPVARKSQGTVASSTTVWQGPCGSCTYPPSSGHSFPVLIFCYFRLFS